MAISKFMGRGDVVGPASSTDGLPAVFDGSTGKRIKEGTALPTSGTYTPTLTNVSNLDGSTAFACQYARIGSFVIVTGKVAANPTAAGVVQIGISLPIASAFTAVEQCGGSASASAVAGQCAAIIADPTNSRAEMIWTTVDTSNRTMAFCFGYSVL